HALAQNFDGFVGQVGHFNGQVVVVSFADFAQQTAGGDEFVAFGQVGHQVAVLFLAFQLRTNHQEVQHNKHQDDGQHAHQGVFAAGSCLGGDESQNVNSGHVGLLRIFLCGLSKTNGVL